MAIFNGIDKNVFFVVFESWMKQIKWVIKHQGDYNNKSTRNKTRFLKIPRERGMSRTYEPPWIGLLKFPFGCGETSENVHNKPK
jgi:hypothetical protein